MEIKKTKKLLSVLLLLIVLCAFFTMIVSASTYPITAHTLNSGVRNEYYNGNGYSLAAGDELDAHFYFSQGYQRSCGYLILPSYSYTTVKSNNGTAYTSVHMYPIVPYTALYRVWLQNDSSVVMYVTGGSIVC